MFMVAQVLGHVLHVNHMLHTGACLTLTCILYMSMNKNTLNPPLSPLPGGLFISSLFEGVLGGGGVIETRGGVAYM